MSGLRGKYRFSGPEGQEEIDLPRVDFLYAESMELKDWIRSARKMAGLTQARLGEALGVTKGNVSAWENGLHEASYAQLQQIAKIAHMPLPGGEYKHATAAGDTPINTPKGLVIKGPPQISELSIKSSLETNVSEPLMLTAGRAVAVVGEVQGNPDGQISIDDYPTGSSHGWIEIYTTDTSAYGLKVRGDGMRPRIKSGEHIVVEPGIEAQPGDDVVVKFADGSAVVKELLWTRDGEVCLGSVSNAAPPATRPLDTILSIHRIGAIIPRGSGMYRPD